MIILNFGHPFTPKQLVHIEDIAGDKAEKVITIPLQIDQEMPLPPQVSATTEQAKLTALEWQGSALLVNLPGYSTVAACLLAEIEGRSGHLPAIIKTRPVANAVLTEYEVVEIINLQKLRADARTRRQTS